MITRFLWNGMDRKLRLFVLLVLAIGIVLPLLNQLMPKTSALYVPSWVLQLGLLVEDDWQRLGIGSRLAARFFYPAGKTVRNLLLKMLGIGWIDNLGRHRPAAR